MAIITPNDAGSAVTMLTTASTISRMLNGFKMADHSMKNAANGRWVTCVFGPYFAKAAWTASTDKPSQLHSGCRLRSNQCEN